jgi:hypothetical protein
VDQAARRVQRLRVRGGRRRSVPAGGNAGHHGGWIAQADRVGQGGRSGVVLPRRRRFPLGFVEAGPQQSRTTPPGGDHDAGRTHHRQHPGAHAFRRHSGMCDDGCPRRHAPRR